MNLEKDNYNYQKPYYIINANNVAFKTYTQSGVDVSINILDRFNIQYTIEYIKE